MEKVKVLLATLIALTTIVGAAFGVLGDVLLQVEEEEEE